MLFKVLMTALHKAKWSPAKIQWRFLKARAFSLTVKTFHFQLFFVLTTITYNAIQPHQTTCPTCRISIRKQPNSRPCQNAEKIPENTPKEHCWFQHFWSIITTTLNQHLVYACKARKYGTLLYHPNTDLVLLLQQLEENSHTQFNSRWQRQWKSLFKLLQPQDDSSDSDSSDNDFTSDSEVGLNY